MILQPGSLLKSIYSEKAKKFWEISTLLLSYVVPVKSNLEISQNFVAFSEYMNFNCLRRPVVLSCPAAALCQLAPPVCIHAEHFRKNNKTPHFLRHALSRAQLYITQVTQFSMQFSSITDTLFIGPSRPVVPGGAIASPDQVTLSQLKVR